MPRDIRPSARGAQEYKEAGCNKVHVIILIICQKSVSPITIVDRENFTVKIILGLRPTVKIRHANKIIYVAVYVAVVNDERACMSTPPKVSVQSMTIPDSTALQPASSDTQ